MKKIVSAFAFLISTSFCFGQDSTALQVETGPVKYGQIPTPIGSNLRISGTSWTLEAWVFVPASPMPQQMFVIETYSGSATGGFALRINSNYKLMAYQIVNPSSSVVVNGATNVTFGAWNHLAATYNATAQTLNLFLNGVQDGSTSCTLPSSNTNNNLNIGARGDDNNIWQIITIDEVRIWNVARTEAQLAASMNSCLLGNETGLLAYYTFEGQTDATIVDSTANNNDGTITSFAATVLVDGVFDCTVSTAGYSEDATSIATVYPNPTRSNLTIHTKEVISAVHIYNTAGLLIQSENKNSFSVENLPTGIYFWKIQTENGIATSRFVKE
ncbi:MAG: T9SS type A sorting domain-containing protein [Crocinitomicaceae bacterium]|nr:T9SS type A sorting domain-containing protein [Crocinitomicaceae bacterium]